VHGVVAGRIHPGSGALKGSIMIPERAKITGLVLAGGRGSRMGGEDKGLIPFRGRPMAEYAVDVLRQVAGQVLISANRNLEVYARFGCPVVADASADFDGPLAGLLAAMKAAQTPYLLSVPCDAPLLDARYLLRLCETLAKEGAEVCVADDGSRIHPVFALIDVSLATDLEAYLCAGERKVQAWLRRHRLALADFRDCPERLANINSQEDLSRLEAGAGP